MAAELEALLDAALDDAVDALADPDALAEADADALADADADALADADELPPDEHPTSANAAKRASASTAAKINCMRFFMYNPFSFSLCDVPLLRRLATYILFSF